jgi:hypothetical protein
VQKVFWGSKCTHGRGHAYAYVYVYCTQKTSNTVSGGPSRNVHGDAPTRRSSGSGSESPSGNGNPRPKTTIQKQKRTQRHDYSRYSVCLAPAPAPYGYVREQGVSEEASTAVSPSLLPRRLPVPVLVPAVVAVLSHDRHPASQAQAQGAAPTPAWQVDAEANGSESG